MAIGRTPSVQDIFALECTDARADIPGISADSYSAQLFLVREHLVLRLGVRRGKSHLPSSWSVTDPPARSPRLGVDVAIKPSATAGPDRDIHEGQRIRDVSDGREPK